MKKRNILVLAGSLALVAAIGVGSTLAYFTDTESDTNKVTMGNVNINLTEDSVSGNGAFVVGTDYKTGLQYTNIVPGDKISKVANVSVADKSEACYVRVKIVAEAEKGSDSYKAEVADLVNNVSELKTLDLDKNLVKSEDGYYYYQKVLNSGDNFNVFTTVTIPTSWGNEAADKSFEIYVTAEAIQANNVEDVLTYDGDKIIGWKGVEAEPYKEPTTSAQ